MAAHHIAALLVCPLVAAAAGPVDDPQLVPVPPAPISLTSWAEARRRLDEGSLELRAAEASVAQAHGRWRQSLSSLLPQASLTLGVGFDVLNPASPVPAGGINLGSALFSGGGAAAPTVPLGSAGATLRQSVVDLSAWSALDAADSATRAAEASADDVRRRQTRTLARAVATAAFSERIAEIGRAGLSQALERAALTERLEALGAASQLDVVRVQQDIAVARTALTTVDEALRIAREALGAALGLAEPVSVSPALALDGLVADAAAPCQGLDRARVEERADVASARARRDAAEAARRAAAVGYLPTLDFASSLGAYTSDPGPGRFASWTLAAVIAVPLWEGGLREGLVAERGGAVLGAEAALASARRDALLEHGRAASAERAAAALFGSARDAHALAQELDRLTRRAFELGRADSLDLVQSGVVLRQAQLELALREADWLRARLDAFFTLARCPA